MSLYQVQKFIYQRLQGFSQGTDPGRAVTDGWDLSESERAALEADDVGRLYAMGVHPVLINGYCRALGLMRDDYRALLAPYAAPAERTPRWRR